MLLTLADAKLQLNLTPGDTSLDDELQDYIDAVSSVVERQTGEVVTPRVVDEVHELCGETRVLLRSIPVVEVLNIRAPDGTTWDADAFTVDRTSGLLVSRAPLAGVVTFTVEAGYEQVPPNYNLAARIILQHLWRVQRGPSAAAFGAASGAPEPGMGFAIPRRAQELLGSMMPGIA